MKKQLAVCSVVLSTLVACMPAKDQETQRALSSYKTFVDSIYAKNTVWKTTTDTDYVEMATDPNDPSLFAVDTIITQPNAKEKSILLNPYWGKNIKSEYEKVKAEVDAKTEKMDASMKKEFEELKQKFELMLKP